MSISCQIGSIQGHSLGLWIVGPSWNYHHLSLVTHFEQLYRAGYIVTQVGYLDFELDSWSLVTHLDQLPILSTSSCWEMYILHCTDDIQKKTFWEWWCTWYWYSACVTFLQQMFLSPAPKDSGEELLTKIIIWGSNLWCIHEEKKEAPKADEEDDAKGEVEVKGGERWGGRRWKSLVELWLERVWVEFMINVLSGGRRSTSEVLKKSKSHKLLQRILTGLSSKEREGISLHLFLFRLTATHRLVIPIDKQTCNWEAGGCAVKHQ